MPSPEHQVSVRNVANSLEALAAQGVRPDLRGLDEERLRGGWGWISWSHYLDVLDACAAAMGADGYRRFGLISTRHGAKLPFRHVGALLGGTRRLYQVTYGWIVPSEFRVVTGQVRVEPEAVQIELRLQAGLRPSRGWFVSMTGSMEALPAVLEQPEVRVQAEISDTWCRVSAELPRPPGVVSRLRAAARVFRDAEGVDFAAAELAGHLSGARDSFRSADARLRKMREQWEVATRNMPGVVAIVDAEGRILEMHGAAVPWAPNRPGEHALIHLDPTDRADLERILAGVLAGGPPAEFEVRSPSPLGEPRWWAGRVAGVAGPAGGAVFMAIDITERRRAEQALEQSQQRLMQAQKMDALGRLAGGLAHDFNNVLAAVRGQAELLALTRGEDPAVARATEAIFAATDRASQLTRRLLAQGRRPLDEPMVSDLVAVLRDTEPMLRSVLGERVVLHLSCALDLAPVPLGPTSAQQVLVNLVLNGRDAVGDEGTVEVRLGRDGEQVLLEVGDDGRGMTPEVRERAVEPFFTTKGANDGSGLGLATVYWLVDQAGGELVIDSEPGHGSRVRVVLPLVEPGIEDPPAEVTTDPLARPSLHVLLAEDEDEVRATLTELLGALGHRVVACADGQEALEVSRTQAFDVVLTDLVMPGGDGVQLVKALEPRLPAVLMSGYTDRDPEALLRELGHATFLRKPFGVSALVQALARVVDSAHQASRASRSVHGAESASSAAASRRKVPESEGAQRRSSS